MSIWFKNLTYSVKNVTYRERKVIWEFPQPGETLLRELGAVLSWAQHSPEFRVTLKRKQKLFPYLAAMLPCLTHGFYRVLCMKDTGGKQKENLVSDPAFPDCKTLPEMIGLHQTGFDPQHLGS